MDKSILLKGGKAMILIGVNIKGRGGEGWNTIKERGGRAEDSVMSLAAQESMTGRFALWMALVLFISLCLFDFDQTDINCFGELRSKALRISLMDASGRTCSSNGQLPQGTLHMLNMSWHFLE